MANNVNPADRGSVQRPPRGPSANQEAELLWSAARGLRRAYRGFVLRDALAYLAILATDTLDQDVIAELERLSRESETATPAVGPSLLATLLDATASFSLAKDLQVLRNALEEHFFKALGVKVLRATRSRLRGPDVEDAAQEAFAALVAQKRRKSAKDLWTMAFTVASNKAHTAIRRRRSIPADVGDGSEVVWVDRADERRVVQDWYTSLSDRDKKIVILRLEDDNSYEEIAAVLDEKYETVRRAGRRAFERVLEALSEERR